MYIMNYLKNKEDVVPFVLKSQKKDILLVLITAIKQIQCGEYYATPVIQQ